MFFFVNQYFLSRNSSVEHAEIKRLQLFARHNWGAKLVSRDYDSIIHATLKRFGLTDDQLVNMFDFFAQTEDYHGQQWHVEDLDLPAAYQVGTGNNSRDIMDGQRLVGEVYFIGGTIGQVDHVDFFDPAGNLTLRQRFDIRGFKSVDQFFGKDGQMYYERYYRPDKTLYLERYYIQSDQNTPLNSLNVLRDYKGKDYYFDSFDDLFVFFLDELNLANGGHNAFIADRPAISIQPVLAMTSSAKKYLWLSINHVNDGQNLLNGPINDLFQPALTSDLQKWAGIIVMTPQQARNLRNRLGDKAPLIVINGTPVITTRPRIPQSQRTPGQLIYVGRLGEDKQISQLLTIFAAVHRQCPTSKLTLYGYGNEDDVKRYRQQVANAGLQDVVTFAGYQVDLDQDYDQAQIFVDTSRIDAQPLAMGEALSHGVPVVTYDYLYGPAVMVKPGVNGELVRLNNQNAFARQLVKLLQDPAQLQKLSTGAYDNLGVISDTATWQQWKQLIN